MNVRVFNARWGNDGRSVCLAVLRSRVLDKPAGPRLHHAVASTSAEIYILGGSKTRRLGSGARAIQNNAVRIPHIAGQVLNEVQARLVAKNSGPTPF